MNSAFDIAFNNRQEEQTKTLLEIEGAIPEWLNGSFYRNGPGLFSTKKDSYKHWFDGPAMIHRFKIKEGQVEYSSKYLETKTKKEIFKNEKISYPEFATDPCGSIFNKMKTWYIATNPKVNLTYINDRFIALGETIMQLEIDKETLETIGVHRYTNSKYNVAITTAHPHAVDNKLYNLILKMGMFNFYDILKYDVDSKSSESICKIPIANPAYIHSIGMSENYFILAHFPFECTSLDFLLKKKPFVENFKWKDNKKSIIWIIEKRSGKIISKKKVNPFFAFHFTNAYEENDSLIFDLCSYPNADIIHSFYLDRLEDLAQHLDKARLERYEFDLNTKSIEKSVVSDHALELATIDDRCLRKDYTYLYGLGISNEGPKQFYDQIVKLNVKTGESKIWRDPDYYAGEPKFLPDPNGNSDDDGILISILLNIKNKKKGSKLLILDANTLTEIASCYTPHSIVPGFHNYFLS